MRSPRGLSVPLRLERDRPEPLQDQLARQLRRAIDTGRLAPGARIPSTRGLAAILQVSRGVTLAAYEILFAQGYIDGRHGSGTYVTMPGGDDREDPAVHGPRATGRSDAPVDMRPGRPASEAFPIAAWRAAWRHAGHAPPPSEEPPPPGLPELREAVAAHLRETRGLVLGEHEVIITGGHGHALLSLLHAQAKESGRTAAGLEDPAPPRLRAALGGHGAVLPVPNDGSGARPDLIPAACGTVVLMPERNDPLGTRMPTRRRHAVAAWAAERGGLVVEPAFDGVLNPSVAPRASVMALGDPAHTAMTGTFCDVLTPALRLAYAVVPRRLAAAAGEAVAAAHAQPSLPCQRAVAHLLASGCVARRAERLAVLYAPKRALVRQALDACAGVRLVGADTGSSATLLLPASVRAAVIVRALRERHVLVADLSAYYQRAAGNGIVLGHGHLREAALHRALRVVARTLGEHGLARDTAGRSVA
ncbi:PLP-dependent aminotransferase family protein [Spongiactinospora sp. TRM90649]|uniref:aminotransferase-like domain-containing protein n=1 Tax=Spongiactinospora sp. TRM90649 TaxID=3031114 RepID=UPI0023F744CD|nr:PLP-dependent aminotransferase family protein [Spongiactinospora sp. TRM90649]MDF5758157.1 PLP-dependent aminotransferase family protein [Spongiactinospora sp. TRM90649]